MKSYGNKALAAGGDRIKLVQLTDKLQNLPWCRILTTSAIFTPLGTYLSGNGVLVVNPGTPDVAEKKAVGRFLAEVLSDPQVVDLPR